MKAYANAVASWEIISGAVGTMEAGGKEQHQRLRGKVEVLRYFFTDVVASVELFTC